MFDCRRTFLVQIIAAVEPEWAKTGGKRWREIYLIVDGVVFVCMAKKKWKKKERLERAAEPVAKDGGSNSKLVIAGIVVLVLASFFIFGSGGDNGPVTPPPAAIAGKYTLSDKASTHVAGEVTLVEFFDFYCSHCYTFHRSTWPALSTRFEGAVKLVDMGYPLRKESFLPLEAYEVARDMGGGEEFKDATFSAIHVDGRDVSSVAVLTEIAVSIGLDESGFKSALESGSKEGVIEDSRRLGNSYKLTGTPTIIVDGNMKSSDNSLGNLQTMIDSILSLDTV